MFFFKENELQNEKTVFFIVNRVIEQINEESESLEVIVLIILSYYFNYFIQSNFYFLFIFRTRNICTRRAKNPKLSAHFKASESMARVTNRD